MPHELSIVNGQAECFCAGERPWHGLGTLLEQRVTSFEAIKAAHLEWEVELREITASGLLEACPNHKATVRTDLNKVLGIVGKRYRPLQNRDAFTFFDNVVGLGEAIYESAGALFGGRRVWILAKLNEDMVIGGVDKIKPYLLLVNSHDGSQAVRMFFTPIRVVCNNTLTASINRRSVGEGVMIRHTESMNGKIEESQEILGIAQKEYERIGAAFNLFYDKQIDADQAKGYFDRVFELNAGELPKDKETEDELMAAYEGHGSAAEATHKDTVWRAYNVATHRVDHELPFRRNSSKSLQARAENRMKSICFGTGAATKAKAYSAALQLCS